MAENKTTPTTRPPREFLDSIENADRRSDSLQLLELMTEITGEQAVMWGESIVGFGTYRYTYASGRQGDWMLTGFSPRKQNLTVYLMDGTQRHQELLDRLGPHKTGKSCLYLKSLGEVDPDILRRLITDSVAAVRRKDIRY